LCKLVWTRTTKVVLTNPICQRISSYSILYLLDHFPVNKFYILLYSKNICLHSIARGTIIRIKPLVKTHVFKLLLKFCKLTAVNEIVQSLSIHGWNLGIHSFNFQILLYSYFMRNIEMIWISTSIWLYIPVLYTLRLLSGLKIPSYWYLKCFNNCRVVVP